MTGPWTGGVQVRNTDWGQVPVADLHCAACGHHKRVTGRDRVAEFMHANPIADHRANCPATTTPTQGAPAA